MPVEASRLPLQQSELTLRRSMVAIPFLQQSVVVGLHCPAAPPWQSAPEAQALLQVAEQIPLLPSSPWRSPREAVAA
ncbi:MAG TPA: hypothetical protein VGK67_28190 [Myxococcales bacterium]